MTRGKGVAVHSLNCPNVQNLMYEVERKIDVEWARSESTDAFPVQDRGPYRRPAGHAEPADLACSSTSRPISAAWKRARTTSAATGRMIDMTVDVRDKKQLERVVSAIRRISGVRDVERTQ